MTVALLLVATALLPSPSVADAPPADFPKDGTAFLRKHCLHCHGDKEPKGGVNLGSYRDEDSALKGRKVLQKAAQLVESGEMPPESRPRPPAADAAAFVRSVRGVLARADGGARPDPGKVTLRRLNRTEYNNTIRDLFGVDFNPAEDFPADGVGYGFDNIADVLSLSPVLLDRYLAAAEGVVQRVHVTPPRQVVLRTPALFLNPQGNDLREGFRPLFANARKLEMALPAGHDGEYVVRGKVYAQQAGDEPVKAALLLDGQQLKTFEVKADSLKTAQVIEFKTKLDPGPHPMLFGIAIANEFKNADGQRTLWVGELEVTGPPDNRPASQRRLFPVVTGKSKAEQTRDTLARLATRAYRRPATADEVGRLVKLAEAAEARGAKGDAAIKTAVEAVLVSPKFLFRVELDDRPDSAEPHPLNEYQLASRLSYFLWSSMPDDELFALAEKKELTKNLDAQVKRMLQDPKAKALVDNFAMQWLQVRRLQAFAPDAKLFPTFNDALRKAMLKETELFFEAVMREDRSILDLIDADFTFLNEPLAKHYGIVDTNGTRTGQKPATAGGRPIRGEQFQRVRLADGERGGILTQASVLTATSNPTRTSPVKRGHWVLQQVLGTPPPPPPPNVPALPETEKAILSGSVRQRLEQHRANPACANCHAHIDPIGFAFENYDSIGAFRTRDGTFPIDASGTLPDGKTFRGPGELKAILKAKKELFGRCLAEKMLTYALGRGVEEYDGPALDRITASLGRADYRFSALVTEIVRSDPFRLRRGNR
jgi:hypothetical protein